jgi:hypothetical protein
MLKQPALMYTTLVANVKNNLTTLGFKGGGGKGRGSGIGGPPAGSHVNSILREDGTYLLREDGSSSFLHEG